MKSCSPYHLKSSIGFMPGLFPDQSISYKSWEVKKPLIVFAWWQGVPSCMNISSLLRYHLFVIWGNRRLCIISLHYSGSLYPWTTLRLLVPYIEMMLNITIVVGFLTVCLRQNFLPSFLLTKWELSLITSFVDLSEKHTWNYKLQALNIAFNLPNMKFIN